MFRDTSSALFRSCLSAFGEEVTYLRFGEEARQVTGIFSQAYVLVKEPGFDSEISSGLPVFEFQECDLGFKPSRRDHIKVGQQMFKIHSIEPNNQGQIKLILKKVERSLIEQKAKD